MSAPVSLPELKKMHLMAAELVTRDPVYLPVFERIEHELAVFEGKDDVIRRARAVVACQRATAA